MLFYLLSSPVLHDRDRDSGFIFKLPNHQNLSRLERDFQIKMINIYLIRHAQTEYNRNHQYIGGRSSHLEINEKGWEQATQLGEFLQAQNFKFHQVYCSTAKRAKQTLEGIQKTFAIEAVQYSEQLEELSQGDWEGQLRDKIYTTELLETINSNNYSFKAPNGESQQEVEERMYQFIEEEILPHDRKNIMILTHGMAIKCLLRKIMDSSPAMTYKIKVDNTSITKLAYSKKKGWELHYVNSRLSV
jgi:broad specificity phosphatase PhoE